MRTNPLIYFIAVFALLTTLILVACGDSTNTAAPAATSNAGSTIASTAAPTTNNAATTTAVATASTPGPSAMTGNNKGSMTTSAATTTTSSGAATTGAQTATAGAAMGGMPGQDMGSMGSDPMTASLKGLSGKDFEVKFMQEMIVHHQSALDMAKLIPTNTKRPELIKLGQDIITAQTKEIGDMTGWLANWYNEKPVGDSMSVPGMMEMMGDMDKLKTAKDADFDKMFLQMMISHHQQAVNMAALIPSKTERPELVKLGQDITRTQTAEINQMKDWRSAWFKTS